MVYWIIFGAWKTFAENKFADVIWRHLCLCPLIDHDQQPIKIHTDVALLYKLYYPYRQYTPIFLYSNVYLNTAYAAHYVSFTH